MATILYLKFSNKEEAYEKLSDFRGTLQEPDGTEMTYWKDPENYTFDEIGTIYKPTGNMLTDEDGNEYPEMEAIEGWHMNVLCVNDATPIIDKLDSSNIITPSTPSRGFAGYDN